MKKMFVLLSLLVCSILHAGRDAKVIIVNYSFQPFYYSKSEHGKRKKVQPCQEPTEGSACMMFTTKKISLKATDKLFLYQSKNIENKEQIYSVTDCSENGLLLIKRSEDNISFDHMLFKDLNAHNYYKLIFEKMISKE